MLTIVLSIILGYFLISLTVVLGRFVFHWCRAVWSKSVWFNMALSGPASEAGLYSTLSIVPLFYDEPKSHFSLTFTLLGFKTFFVPVQTIGRILKLEFGAYPSWQVLHDSARIPATRIDTSGSGSAKTGFSPGTDLIFFAENEIGKEHIDQFVKEAGKTIVPGRLVEHVCQVFNPRAFILKDGNRWSIGYKDPEIRRRIITSLFEEVGRKVLLKNRLKGDVRIRSGDGADRFIARGQVRWWMKGSLRDDSIVIEGDGLRPGEVTSADWALVTIPIEKATNKTEALNTKSEGNSPALGRASGEAGESLKFK